MDKEICYTYFMYNIYICSTYVYMYSMYNIQWNIIQPWKEISPFVTKWIKPEGIMLSEITPIEKDE